MKKAILVVGPPRSGTSVVSNILSKLKVDFGDPGHFVDPALHKHNPIFFELQSLNKINDEIFTHFSKQWSTFDWFPERVDFDESVISIFEGKISRFIAEEFSNSKIVGLKDPRFCYTLPLWEVILNRLGFNVDYILVRRSSNSIFNSNKLINKYSSAVNFRLVAQSSLIARYFVEGKTYLAIDYEDLLATPNKAITRICNTFNLDCSHDNEAQSVIRNDLGSQKKKSNTQIYNYFTNVIDSKLFSPDEYLQYREIFFAAIFEKDQKIAFLNNLVEGYKAQIDLLSQSMTEHDLVIVNHTEEVAERDDRITNLTEKVVEYDDRITNLTNKVAERDSRIINLTEKVVEYEDQITRLTKEFSKSGNHISNLTGEIGVLGSQIIKLEQQLDTSNLELLRLNAERATFGAKIGRSITRLRTRIAPVGTRRGTVITLASKFASTFLAIGFKGSTLAVYRNISIRLRSNNPRRKNAHKFSSILGSNDVNLDSLVNTNEKVQTDHPQLSEWIAEHEPNKKQLIDQKYTAGAFDYTPLISVIIPIYRVPRNVLMATLSSLNEQTYQNWQACIVWADPEDVDGWEWLMKITDGDKRYKTKYLDKNGGISRNSNAALEFVDGEYVALLDHDDTLAPSAFFEIVKLLQTSPELDFIYSDKDSITADGQVRLNALFKPGWSPEMLHSVNYLTHLNVMRTHLVREIGGWRPETDGAQDWDIFFRVTERTDNIARVPSILYHWRILPTSTATGLQAKPYAANGQLRTQQSYFKRKGLAATVIPTPEGLFHVKWPLKPASTDVVVYQTGTLKQLLKILNLLRAGKKDVIRHIHVVHSTPDSGALFAFKKTCNDCCFLTQQENIGWQSALSAADLDNDKQTILLLDGSVSDISDDLVEELSGWVAQHPDIVWASAIALNLEGTVYEAGRVVSSDYRSAPMLHGSPVFSFGWFGGPLWYRNASASSPYAVAMKAHDVNVAMSKFNWNGEQERKFSEFCLLLTSDGHRGLINPFAKVFFKQSPESDWPNEGQLYHDDPYFNPAFTQVNPLRLHL